VPNALCNYRALSFSNKEPETLEWIDSMDKEAILWDIGANVGEYTKLLLHNTNSKVVSFEPLPEAFRELEKIKLEFQDRLNIYNVAIGIDNNKLDLLYFIFFISR
jgi:hypothetical protein